MSILPPSQMSRIFALVKLNLALNLILAITLLTPKFCRCTVWLIWDRGRNYFLNPQHGCRVFLALFVIVAMTKRC